MSEEKNNGKIIELKIIEDYKIEESEEAETISGDSEKDFFRETKQDKEFYNSYEPEGENEAPEGADSTQDDFFKQYEQKFEEPKENFYETYTTEDEQNFILAWKFIDETRAAVLAAKFKQDKNKLLFYPDIDKQGNNGYLKKAGGAVFRKYSNSILFSNTPEVILLFAFLFSTYWMYQAAAKMEKQRPPTPKTGQKTPFQTAEKTEDKNHFKPTQTS